MKQKKVAANYKLQVKVLISKLGVKSKAYFLYVYNSILDI